MIAIPKLSILTLIILSCGNILYGQSLNRYLQIAVDYNIHPPSLEYGYPLWYQFNEQETSGIIYLSNEIEYLEKIDGRTYVTKPTKENAKIIANSIVNNQKPKYYLIIDSKVSTNQLLEFISEFSSLKNNTILCLVSNEGKYVKLFTSDRDEIICFPDSYPTIIAINSSKPQAILFDNNLINSSKLSEVVYEEYFGEQNKSGNKKIVIDSNWTNSTQQFISKNEFNLKKDSLMIIKSKNNLSINDSAKRKLELEFIKQLDDNLKKEKVYLSNFKMKVNNDLFLFKEFGNFKKMNNSYEVIIKIYGQVDLNHYFTVLNEIQFGVLAARDSFAQSHFNTDYNSLLEEGGNRLDLINTIYPDRIQFLLNFPESIPIIEEIQVVDTILDNTIEKVHFIIDNNDE